MFDDEEWYEHKQQMDHITQQQEDMKELRETIDKKELKIKQQEEIIEKLNE